MHPKCIGKSIILCLLLCCVYWPGECGPKGGRIAPGGRQQRAPGRQDGRAPRQQGRRYPRMMVMVMMEHLFGGRFRALAVRHDVAAGPLAGVLRYRRNRGRIKYCRSPARTIQSKPDVWYENNSIQFVLRDRRTSRNLARSNDGFTRRVAGK